MNKLRNNMAVVIALLIVTTAAVFFINTFYPNGYNTWMLYLFPILLVYWAIPISFLIPFTALVSILMITSLSINYYSSPGTASFHQELFHKLAGICIFTTLTVILEHLKKTREKVIEKETDYFALFENVSEGVAYCKMIFSNKKPIDFVYLKVNKHFEIQTGLKEVEGKFVTKVIPGIRETDDNLFEIYGRVALTGVSEKFEIQMKSLGDWYSVTVYCPKKEHFVAIYEVITERKKTEAQLRLKSKIVEGMSEGVNIVRISDGIIVYANKSFEQMFGYNKKELLGKPIKILNAPIGKSHEANAREIIHTIKQSGCWRGELQNIKKNGEIFWCRANITNFDHSEFGKVLLAVHQDITEFKLIDEIRKKHEIQLIESNATKDKLFSIIAHDLRNPVHNIMSFSDLVNEYFEENNLTDSMKFLSYLNAEAKHTTNLLENLLTWSNSQSNRIKFKPEIINLHPIMQETINALEASAKNKGIILNYVQIDSDYINADEDMLRLILRNLLTNAIKFTNKGGCVDVFAHNEANMFKITIADNGIGMNEEKLKKLFKIDKHNSTKGTADETGTGLGLILCKEFVEKHGGNIWAESEESKGSRFYVTFHQKIIV